MYFFTAVQLANNALSVLKSVRELAKDSSDLALKEQINTLYDMFLELKEFTLSQDEEIRQLKAQLEDKIAYIGPVAPHGYVYEGVDLERQHPLCPTCYQSTPQHVAFMDEAKPWNGGIRRTCKLCNRHIYEQPMERATVTRVLSPGVY